ncbi:hypothetical protein C1646_667058 [Rhizophagus diaphanus]|nr:hypothetical protein C1646_667058 [Rhizophagus diaphanus] [Rhizophagus sp. MUCL 43196]
MTQSVQILKPLMHLKYTKKFAYPLQEDYDFPIPYLKTPDIPVSTNEQISYETPAPTLTEPIDLSKAESKAWKNHIQQLKFRKESELRIKQEGIERREKAKSWNMSIDVIDQRLLLAAQLTTLQDLHGKKALIELEILKIPLTSNTNKKKVMKLDDKIRKLSPPIDEILSSLSSLKGTPYYVSAEDCTLELRPNKRMVNITHNLDLLLSLHPEKRVCTRDSPESRLNTSSTFIG